MIPQFFMRLLKKKQAGNKVRRWKLCDEASAPIGFLIDDNGKFHVQDVNGNKIMDLDKNANLKTTRMVLLNKVSEVA